MSSPLDFSDLSSDDAQRVLALSPATTSSTDGIKTWDLDQMAEGLKSLVV